MEVERSLEEKMQVKWRKQTASDNEQVDGAELQ